MIGFIASLLVTLGVVADNIVVAGWCGYASQYFKPYKFLLILFLLFTIQLHVFTYGLWIRKHLIWNNHDNEKWISLILMFSMALMMLLELRGKNIPRKLIFSLDDFISISLLTAIYPFILGIALQKLCEPKIIFIVLISSITISLIFGWFIGKTKKLFTKYCIRIANYFGIIVMFIGIILFLNLIQH